MKRRGRDSTGAPPQAILVTLADRNALALDRKMRELSLDTPYVIVLEPPTDYPKLRRHMNPRYQFVPLEGYQQPVI